MKRSLFLISDESKDQRQRKSRQRHTREKESAGLSLGFFFFFSFLLSPSKVEDPAGPVWIFIKKKPKIINFFVFVLFAVPPLLALHTAWQIRPAPVPGCWAAGRPLLLTPLSLLGPPAACPATQLGF